MTVEVFDLDPAELAQFERKVSWLSAADPDDWHRVMLDFHWSEELYLLDWIVRQDQCDIATALEIFWLGEPSCWVEEEGSSDEEPNGFSYLNREICAYIAKRVGSGGYSRSEIAFTPNTWRKVDYVRMVEDEKAYDNPNIRTHPDLIKFHLGRKVVVNTDFYNRYPEEFHLSHFDEELSEALDSGLLYIPETFARAEQVDEIEQATRRSLPEWLQETPEGTDSRIAVIDTDVEASERIKAIRRQIELRAKERSSSRKTFSLSDWMRKLTGRK